MTLRQPFPSEVTIDRLVLGRVTCDFLTRQAFWTLVEKWLNSNHFHHVVTLNPEMVVQAETDTQFREAVQKATLRIPDGAGLVWAQWYIRSEFWALLPSLFAFSFRHVERIQGVEAVEQVARLCVERKLSLYLLGGTAAQVNGTAEKLRAQFPGIAIATSPDHAFDLGGPPEIIRDIQEKKPAVLLAAYGAPKQTVWIERHRQDFPSVKAAIGVGGAFAILSEERPRAPRFLRRLNMEWLWRLLLEPTRFPRIWRAVVTFPSLVRRQKIQTYSH